MNNFRPNLNGIGDYKNRSCLFFIPQFTLIINNYLKSPIIKAYNFRNLLNFGFTQGQSYVDTLYDNFTLLVLQNCSVNMSLPRRIQNFALDNNIDENNQLNSLRSQTIAGQTTIEDYTLPYLCFLLCTYIICTTMHLTKFAPRILRICTNKIQLQKWKSK